MASSSSPNKHPLPRMTDSMPNQAGPGPSSFKLAALSAQSYHLDSPPFTGTAGPLGEPLGSHEGGWQQQQQQEPSSFSSANLTGQDMTPASSKPTRPRMTSSSGAGMPNLSSEAQGSQASNSDVPRWSLDRPRQSAAPNEGAGVPSWLSSNSSAIADDSQGEDDGAPRATLSHSLSPPPFSSSGQGPMSSSVTSAGPAAAAAIASTSATNGSGINTPLSSYRQHHRRESSRPSFTRISDSNSQSNGDGGSATTDADGDADASENSDPDGEVDGDETAYVVRGRSSQPGRVPVQGQTKEEYKFPRHRLPTKMKNETKIPLVIVACGSFSPPTYLHLRIFEMAKDQVIESGKYELLGGYYSPVSDYYRKEGLAKATHRVRMCELAVEKTSTWLMVDAWESLQDEYQRTAVVLDHFDEVINGGPQGGVQVSDGSRRKIRIMLLAGGDLIQSMGEPGVWADADLHHILGKYGCMIVERTGADVWSFLLSHDLLWRYRKNLKVVKQTIFNDISSSKVRLFVRRGQSIKYLLPNSVIHYIEQHQLYRLPKELDTEPPDADHNLM